VIDSSLSKMAFSEAYVGAVAAAAGFLYEPDRFDLDSIDGTIKGERALARFDVQLKCTSQSVLKEDHVAFRLEIRHYNELRETETARPLLLVVVVAPPKLTDWVNHSEERMLLRRCGYWTWLQGGPPSMNQTWQSIRIPRGNLFDVLQLKRMMSRVTRGVAIDGSAP
jgi:hypothetical protein